jgi:hypothetical protein
MRKLLVVSCIAAALAAGIAGAGVLDVMKGIEMPSGGGSDDGTTASGLKEALAIGTRNAVSAVSKTDGYFGNQAIKILMPGKLQTVAKALSKVGYQREVDEFILSMNRAAEKAAPQAASYFEDAIREMTFEDARKILQGGDTSATDYFKSKTFDKLYHAFKPPVSESMNEVGVTRAYKGMIGKYTSSVPFAKEESFDLDHYVTTKSLDGLFYMLGQEEKKIRTDPAARVTDLLKKVFGK